MYNNIGEKIKILAKGVFAVEAIGAVAAAIALIVTDEAFLLTGLLIIVCGPLIALVSSWVLYAFGQLVEDVHNMNAPQKVAKQDNKHTEKEKASEKPLAKTVSKSKCELCGKESENLKRCKINDDIGWADICEECAKNRQL